jgi:hypothetical protein
LTNTWQIWIKWGKRSKLTKCEIKKWKITTNTKETLWIIRGYFENLFSNKLESLEEMDKFLDAYDHSKLSQEDINHLSRSITSNEIKVAKKVS